MRYILYWRGVKCFGTAVPHCTMAKNANTCTLRLLHMHLYMFTLRSSFWEPQWESSTKSSTDKECAEEQTSGCRETK